MKQETQNQTPQSQPEQAQLESQSFGRGAGEARRSFFSSSIKVAGAVLSALALSGMVDRPTQASEATAQKVENPYAAKGFSPIPLLSLEQRIERALQKELKKLAQGNQGDAAVDISYNPKTGLVKGEGWIRHKHRARICLPGSDFSGGRKIPLTVYNTKVKFEFEYNVKTGKGDAEIKLGRGVKLNLGKFLDKVL